MNNLDQGQRLWQVLNDHYEELESKVYFFQQITENPIEYVKMLAQGLHGDLLMFKKEGLDIWPKSIQSASMAARILEIITGDDTPPKYQGSKWRSWD